MMKKVLTYLLTMVLIFTFTGCTSASAVVAEQAALSQAKVGAAVVESASDSEIDTTGFGSTSQVVAAASTVSSLEAAYDREDLETGIYEDLSTILLQGDTVQVDASGAVVDGSTVTINAAGAYSISGVLNDGQIIVDTQDEESVILILNGAEITCSDSAPVYVRNAEKTVITLADGTENQISDGMSYVLEDETDEPDAAIFSKADLTINGSGSLTVNASYNHGIVSKDDLKITDGELTVTAVGDGIKGRDSITIKDGTITIDAGGDGLQSNNDEDASKGTVLIEGGMLVVNAGTDGIQAETSLVVNGGVLQIAAGDDGMHSETTLEINGGEIVITQSYEGIESAALIINGGDVHLNASDDGINGSGGVDGSSLAGQFGQNEFAEAGGCSLTINGGNIVVNASGDGIDINGAIEMTAGLVIVNGPTNNGNGALDYLGAFNISGGLLVAAGSAGMAQAPSETSTQYSVLQTFQSMLSAGTLVRIETESGEEILTFAPSKEFQTIVFSSPELDNGETYVVYTGGSNSGTAADGLFSGGEYSGGKQVASFTISSMVTGGGAGMMGGPGGMGGPEGGRPGRP